MDLFDVLVAVVATDSRFNSDDPDLWAEVWLQIAVKIGPEAATAICQEAAALLLVASIEDLVNA